MAEAEPSGSGTAERLIESLAWAFLESRETPLVLLNRQGRILAANRAWRDGNLPIAPLAVPLPVGESYLASCRTVAESGTAGSDPLVEGLEAVLSGAQQQLTIRWLAAGRRYEVRLYSIPHQDGSCVLAAHEDISERAVAEDHLLLSESVASRFSEPIMITQGRPIDAPGPQILYVNAAFTAMSGYSAAEAVGRDPRFLQGSATDRAALDRIRRALELWQPIREQVLNYRKDGTPFWVELMITPASTGGGRFTHWVSEQRDITPQRRAEEALRLSEARFRLAFERNPTPMWVFDRSTLAFLEVNEAAVIQYGYTRAEFLGMRIVDIRPPEDVRALEASLAAAGEARTPSVWRHRRRDGSIIQVEVSGQRFGEAGQELELIAARDVTAQQQAAARAGALSRLDQALTGNLDPSMIHQLIVERAGELLPCDQASVLLHLDGWATVAASWGVPPQPVGARIIPVAESTITQKASLAGAPTLIADTEANPEWHPYPPWTGPPAVRSMIISPLVVDGTLVGSFTLGSHTPNRFTDEHLALVAELSARVELALRAARLYAAEQARTRAAEALAQAQRDFVSAVSHELRTPLAAIIGYAILLDARWGEADAERRQEWIAKITASAQRQLRLVEDLLLLGRLERGTLAPAHETLRIAALVRRAAEEVGFSYKAQSIALTGPEDLLVLADADRTAQVLINLLDNAAKYSPEGSPIVVRWETQGDHAVVRVRDHGPGVPESGRELLFSRFGRLEGAAPRPGKGGTGLGLFLSRILAEAMDGSLELESTGPQGSTFVLRLPLASPPS